MKIAVTGASGFIGRHVLKDLVDRKVDIVAITRDATHLADAGSSLKVVEMDIGLASADCYDLLGRPDVLIHLAWDGLPNYNSLHHFETELPKHYRFLKAMVEAGLSSLLVTGTCFEYGMQSGPLSEDLPALPDNPYGYAKDCLRRQLEFMQTFHKFELCWGRLFYMYGEGQAPSALFSLLKQAISRGDRVFDMSGGEQLRDYLPVEEVAKYIVTLAVDRCNSGIVNICSGQPISVRKLVEQWLRENDWDISLNLGRFSYPTYEPMAFWGNAGRLHALLGNP